MLRGAGQFEDGETVLLDYNCPAGEGNGTVIPSVVLIDSPAFAEPAAEKHYRSLKGVTVFQATIEGTISCRSPLRLRRSDDGDVVGGNGYGPYGYYKCQMRDAKVHTFHAIVNKERPGYQK